MLQFVDPICLGRVVVLARIEVVRGWFDLDARIVEREVLDRLADVRVRQVVVMAGDVVIAPLPLVSVDMSEAVGVVVLRLDDHLAAVVVDPDVLAVLDPAVLVVFTIVRLGIVAFVADLNTVLSG